MDTKEDRVCRFSIDVEAGGDNPHDRALLEIGISVVDDESQCFEVMLKPDSSSLPYDRHALRAIRRPISQFMEHGVDPVLGINATLDWIDETRGDRKAIFVGVNMPYDWMFFKIYVARVRAANTLPYQAYDILSYGSGVYGLQLSGKGKNGFMDLLCKEPGDLISKYNLALDQNRPHMAVDDAKYQARLLLALEEVASRKVMRS